MEAEELQRREGKQTGGSGSGGGGSGPSDGSGPSYFEKCWKGVIQNAIIEGEFIPGVYPVVLGGTNPDGGHKPNHWAPFVWEVIKEARKSVCDYGLQNPYTQSFMDSIFGSNILCPYDCQRCNYYSQGCNIYCGSLSGLTYVSKLL